MVEQVDSFFTKKVFLCGSLLILHREQEVPWVLWSEITDVLKSPIPLPCSSSLLPLPLVGILKCFPPLLLPPYVFRRVDISKISTETEGKTPSLLHYFRVHLLGKVG